MVSLAERMDQVRKRLRPQRVLGEPQRASQARRRICVDGQHLPTGFGIGLGQQRRQRRLANASLSSDGDLHVSIILHCFDYPHRQCVGFLP